MGKYELGQHELGDGALMSRPLRLTFDERTEVLIALGMQRTHLHRMIATAADADSIRMWQRNLDAIKSAERKLSDPSIIEGENIDD